MQQLKKGNEFVHAVTAYIRLVLQRYSNLDLRTARLRANAKQFNCKTNNLTSSLILQEAKGFAFPLTATQFPPRSFGHAKRIKIPRANYKKGEQSLAV